MVWKRHEDPIPKEDEEYALNMLEKIGHQVFGYTYKFVIMDDTYASIRGHWHRVASDLNPISDDFAQVLGTPWIRVVQVRLWK